MNKTEIQQMASKLGSLGGKKRWKNVSKEGKSQHGKLMAEASARARRAKKGLE